MPDGGALGDGQSVNPDGSPMAEEDIFGKGPVS